MHARLLSSGTETTDDAAFLEGARGFGMVRAVEAAPDDIPRGSGTECAVRADRNVVEADGADGPGIAVRIIPDVVDRHVDHAGRSAPGESRVPGQAGSDRGSPLAGDFHAFAEAGRRLAALHLGYETCEEYPLRLDYAGKGAPALAQFRLGHRAMRFADADRTVLIVNDLVRLSGIPPQAHEYRVNGRTPLEWLIDRYRIVRDRQSGIVNDPNGWFDDPRDLIPALRRIVQVSVETVAIIAGLPCPFAELREQSNGERP